MAEVNIQGASGSDSTANTALLVYGLAVLVSFIVRKLGVGHSKAHVSQPIAMMETQAICSLAIVHVGFYGGMIYSTLDVRWPSDAYWKATVASILAIVWMVLTTHVQ